MKSARFIRWPYFQAVQSYVSTLRIRGALRAGVDLVCRRKGGSKKLRLEVGLRRKKVKGRGKYQMISTRIEAAYDVETRRKTLAAKYQLGPKAIRHNSVVIGSIFLDAQNKWLEHIEEV